MILKLQKVFYKLINFNLLIYKIIINFKININLIIKII